MKHYSMHQVSKSYFDNYMKNRQVQRVKGETFHSEYFLDEKGEYIAYVETSSWSMDVIYKLKDAGVNDMTIDFVGKFLSR